MRVNGAQFFMITTFHRKRRKMSVKPPVDESSGNEIPGLELDRSFLIFFISDLIFLYSPFYVVKKLVEDGQDKMNFSFNFSTIEQIS